MADKILLVKGISGLGDRILCVLGAGLYAQLSGRKLVVDWRDESYSSGEVNAFHHLFLSPLCAPADVVPDTESVAPALWRGRLHESASVLRERYSSLNDAQGWRRFSVDSSRLDHPEQVAVMWSYTAELDALMPHIDAASEPLDPARRAALLRKLLHESLTLQPRIRERVERFRQEHFRAPTIGVHIRYTDHTTALRATLEALHERLDREPASRIFLCTDNRQVKRLFENKYGSVISTPHWYAPIPGRPLHYGAHRPDPILTGEEAVVDLYLLAECDELIVDTSSSFAYVATLLTCAPAERVIDVKRRDKLPPRIRHLSARLMRRLRVYSWAPGLLGMLVGRRPRSTPARPAELTAPEKRR